MARLKRSEQKQKKIVRAASTLFSKQGFKLTTLDAIAAKANMAKASLYYYFPDGKESIFSAVVQEEVESSFICMLEVIQKATNPRERLEVYLRERVRIFHTRMLSNRVSDSAREELMPLAQIEMKTYTERELGILEAIISQGKESGEFKSLDSRVSARILQASLKAVTTDSPLQPDPNVRQREEDELLRMLLHGLVV